MPEPPHVHVAKDGDSAKVWLRSMKLEYNRGYSERETRELLEVIAANRDDWTGKWNEFFGVRD